MPLKITIGRKTRDPRKTIYNDMRMARLNWAELSNKEVAEILGRPIDNISLLRRKYAPDTVRPHLFNPSRWDSVDWSMRDCEIARLLGVSRQLVSITRKRRGLR